jgi:hypothetical protein
MRDLSYPFLYHHFQKNQDLFSFDCCQSLIDCLFSWNAVSSITSDRRNGKRLIQINQMHRNKACDAWLLVLHLLFTRNDHSQPRQQTSLIQSHVTSTVTLRLGFQITSFVVFREKSLAMWTETRRVSFTWFWGKLFLLSATFVDNMISWITRISHRINKRSIQRCGDNSRFGKQ